MSVYEETKLRSLYHCLNRDGLSYQFLGDIQSNRLKGRKRKKIYCLGKKLVVVKISALSEPFAAESPERMFLG